MWWLIPAVIIASIIAGSAGGSTSPAPTTTLASKPKPKPWEVPNPRPKVPSLLPPPSWLDAIGVPLVLFVLGGVALLVVMYIPAIEIDMWYVVGILALLVAGCVALARRARRAQLRDVAGSNSRIQSDYQRKVALWEKVEAEQRAALLDHQRQEQEAARQREREATALVVQLVPPPPKAEPVDPTFPDDCRALGRELVAHAAEDQRAAVRADDPDRIAKLAAIERTYRDQLMLLARSDVSIDDRTALHGLMVRDQCGLRTKKAHGVDGREPPDRRTPARERRASCGLHEGRPSPRV